MGGALSFGPEMHARQQYPFGELIAREPLPSEGTPACRQARFGHWMAWPGISG
jgi:hypothetical protein